MIQVIYFVLRQYVRTAPKGPLPDGIELLLISISTSIFSSQGDARMAQVPSALWAWWWCRGISLPVVSYLIHHCSENPALQRLISAVSLFYFLNCLFMTVTQTLWGILIITIVSKRTFLLSLPRFQCLDHRIPFKCSCWIWLGFYDTSC